VSDPPDDDPAALVGGAFDDEPAPAFRSEGLERFVGRRLYAPDDGLFLFAARRWRRMSRSSEVPVDRMISESSSPAGTGSSPADCAASTSMMSPGCTRLAQSTAQLGHQLYLPAWFAAGTGLAMQSLCIKMPHGFASAPLPEHSKRGLTVVSEPSPHTAQTELGSTAPIATPTDAGWFPEPPDIASVSAAEAAADAKEPMAAAICCCVLLLAARIGAVV